MDYLTGFVDFVLHLDRHLAGHQRYGAQTYALLFVVVLLETYGGDAHPPGGPLLFAAGSFAGLARSVSGRSSSCAAPPPSWATPSTTPSRLPQAAGLPLPALPLFSPHLQKTHGSASVRRQDHHHLCFVPSSDLASFVAGGR
jgi:hypothetical protein